MEAEAMTKHPPVNPCCAALKEKYSKLEASRNALRQGVKIQNELIDKLQNENLNLKKAYEEERVRAEAEKMEKANESATRVSLENEISALKTDMLALQQRGGLQAQDAEGDVMLLQTRISELEMEISRLKELVDMERMKAESEVRKAKTEKKDVNEVKKLVKAEKDRADEERRLAEIERKKAQEYQIQLDKLKSEADKVETRKSEEANKKLNAERQKVIKEKKRADLEMAKAEEQRKLAEISQKKAIDEKCRADQLSQQLEGHRQRIEKLQKEINELVSLRKVEASADFSDKHIDAKTSEIRREADESKLVLKDLKIEQENKRLKEEKRKVIREKKRANSEMLKAEEHRKVAEAHKNKAMEEKQRADQLAQQLETNTQRIEELQKKILELETSRKLIDASVILPERNMNYETAEIKLLRKQLKFEKKQVKHAKEVAKFEIGRNNILYQELCCLRQYSVQFSQRLDVLNNSFSHCGEGRDGMGKNIISSPSLNFSREFFSKNPHELHLHCNNELVKPSYTTTDASDCIKQTVECNAPLLPTSGGNYTQCISGIDSKLEPLLRGSNRQMLQSSAINSSTSSFSDRPLMGSQERGAFSVSTSTKLAEEKSNSQPTISSLSGEFIKTRYNENLNVVAENSVRSPLRINAFGRRAGHGKKRKRILSEVKSIEHLYSEGRKCHLQIEDKLSLLHSMLNSQMGQSLQEERNVVPNSDCDPFAEHVRAHKKRELSPEEDVSLQHLCGSNERTDGRAGGIEETNICNQTLSPANDLRGTDQACRDGICDFSRSSEKNLASFKEVMEGNYMKLLDLENAVDEECYQKAIEIPLSPTLPVIAIQSSETFVSDHSNHLVDESSYQGFQIDKDNLVPSGCYNACSRSMRESHSELGISNPYSSGFKEANTSCQSTLGWAHDELPTYCVVFPDTMDMGSIGRIFRATGTCLAQCSTTSQTDHLMQRIMLSILKIEDLLPKEKACVLFSLLLYNFSPMALDNFGKFLSTDPILLLDSFSGGLLGVTSDVKTKCVFEELCYLGELLTLIEDFLLDRRVLVYSNASSESLPIEGSRVNILVNETEIVLSHVMASTHQLVAGGIILASICATINNIGFLYEVSYNIFRMQHTSLKLNILHVFGHVCGSKYFNLEDCSLIMTVMKSLVTFLEKANSFSEYAYCFPSAGEAQPEFPACHKCPFSEGAVSMEVVVFLLFEKLHNYALDGVVCQDPIEFGSSVSFEALFCSEQLKRTSCEDGACGHLSVNCSEFCCLKKFFMPSAQSNSICHENLCHFTDVLSLVELVASNMSWVWTCKNILSQILTFMESCVLESFSTVTVILLGKLGRLGVDASGYEDNGVVVVKNHLSAFLCRNSSRKLGLPIQFATVNALLGLLSLDFERLINSEVELPAVASECNPADSIRKWYSMLSSKQQSLFSGLLQSAGAPNCRTL